MRSFKTEGIIVRRRNFKDADRILTILTKDHGKLIVRASGIRRIPSRRSAHVELLNHCMVTLYNGQAYPVLTEAQTIDSFSSVKEDLDKIAYAYHLCELVDGLCPENQENNQVFHLVKSTLTRLSFEENASSLIRDFQTELLSLLGYLPAGRQDWNKQNAVAADIDMDRFVETIIERKLRSKSVFAKLQ